MTTAIFSIPLLLFSITMCVTPGPNNMMVAASSVNFGYKKTIPHMAGIILGMNLLFLLAASGVAALLLAHPLVHTLLKIVGCIYLLYLAFKIATMNSSKNGIHIERPITFTNALLFQFLNPKGTVIIISAIATFATPGTNYTSTVMGIILTFNIVCFFTLWIWSGLGLTIRKLLEHKKMFRWFNIFLGILTAATVFMIF